MPNISTFDEKTQFIAIISLALHKHGLAAHNLESVINNISQSMNLEVEVFSTPTLLLIDLSDRGTNESKQIAKRLKPGEINLELLSNIDSLGDQVIAGKVSVKDAISKLNDLENGKDLYPNSLNVLAFGAIALTIAILFGTNPTTLLLSFLGGILVGLIAIYLSQIIDISRFSELLLAFFISFLSNLIFQFYPHFNPNLVNICSLIYLVPGVSLTIAIAELATENLVSGTARFMGAIMNLFKLVFGLVIGAYFAASFINNQEITKFSSIDYPLGIQILALLLVAGGFVVLMKTKFENYFWILGAACAGYGSYKLILSYSHEPFIASFIASFSVSLLSSVYARLSNHPALTILIPGITLLVPGSMGLRGLSLVLQEDSALGMNTLIKVFFIGIAIVAGLLLANICLPPKRSL